MTTGDDRAILADRIKEWIIRCREGRQRIIGDSGLRPAFARLARWQSARLAWTHRALAVSERYAPATTFFLTDLYGDRDYGPRDEGLERVYPMIVRLMPRGALASVLLALELHALTQSLDIALVSRLPSPRGPITADAYAEAYRRCDNVTERQLQIDLVARVGRQLDQVVHRDLIYRMVRLAHGPAHMAGLGDLHDFIERGFTAFRHMKGAADFLDQIVAAETAVMEAILAGAPGSQWAHPEDV
jgi:hypothetical protein